MLRDRCVRAIVRMLACLWVCVCVCVCVFLWRENRLAERDGERVCECPYGEKISPTERDGERRVSVLTERVSLLWRERLSYGESVRETPHGEEKERWRETERVCGCSYGERMSLTERVCVSVLMERGASYGERRRECV